MISYGRQSISRADIDAVVEILQSENLTGGPAVEQFEDALKTYFCSNYACAVANGTAALHLTGLALGWQPKDVVITSPITFLATANCIVYAGATPDFADIDPTTYTIDVNSVEDCIKRNHAKGNNVKAVIGIDYAGHPCDWSGLRALADKYDFQLVNDNCHALGASYKDQKEYAVSYADVVVQSYHPVKHITTGEGGAVLTNHRDVYEKVMLLRTHGIEKDPRKIKNYEGPWYYQMYDIGFNYRITDIQCALGRSQLQRLNDFVGKRRIIATKYDSIFGSSEVANPPLAAKDIIHSYHLYPLQINFETIKLSKSELFKAMESKGIRLQVHYIPIHWQSYYQRHYDFDRHQFPNAVEFYNREVSLPIYPDLKESEQNKVIQTLVKHL